MPRSRGSHTNLTPITPAGCDGERQVFARRVRGAERGEDEDVSLTGHIY
jgi:hypothetical protein